MNRIFKLVAPLLALVTFAGLPAFAQDAPRLPVLVIQQVDAEDSDLYAMLIAKANAAAKEKSANAIAARVYVGMAAADHTGAVFVVRAADSFAALTASFAGTVGDPALLALRSSFAAVRKLGPQTSWKAVRFGGAHEGAWIYNAWVNVTDVPGYMKALDELRAGYDKAGMQDIHMNVYRSVSGRTDSSHFVSFNAPSAERLAEFLDTIASADWVLQAVAGMAQYRTIVRTGTYQEISK